MFRSRRGRLVPDCESRGADLVKSVQKIKCQQSHFLRCNAPRCLISEAAEPQMTFSGHVHLHRTADRSQSGRHKVSVLPAALRREAKEGFRA